MNSTTTVRRILAAVPALFMSRVPAVVFAHGGHVNLIPGWVSKNKGGCAMYRHLCLALLMTLGLLQGGRHVAQAASFTFTPIDVPGATFTIPLGINPRGQIVGWYVDSTGGQHGYLYAGGVFTPIDVPGASDTIALGITPSGQIVGAYSNSTGGQHGYLYAGGVFTPIDVPGAVATSASGIINPRGQIVGFYSDSTGTHSFLATPTKK